MTKWILGFVCLVLLTVPSFADDCPIPAKSTTKNTDPVPLCLVAKKIKQALDDYNASPGTSGTPLLKLSTAEFDFKTVRSKSGGLKFSFLIFSIGSTMQVDSTDDVTFSYEVPKTTEKSLSDLTKNPDFSKQLIDTIKAAAEQLKATQAVGAAKFKTLTVNLAYAVKWDFSGGATVPIQLVTLGVNLDRNKTSTQSIKLTFSE